MASEEAKNYAEKFRYNIIPMKSECPNYTGEECMRTSLDRKSVWEIFDAGVESEKKKHEWHYVEKDISDVPPENTVVLVKTTNGALRIATYIGTNPAFLTPLWRFEGSSGKTLRKNVLKWKEIE